MTTATQKVMQISMAADAREGVKEAVGDLSGVEVLYNQLLLGTYIRPEKTKGGVWLTQNARKEDEYQGKVFLVLKMGETAFKDSEDVTFNGLDVKEGDWVVIRPGDGWPITLNGTACRLISDRGIRMRITNPEAVY